VRYATSGDIQHIRKALLQDRTRSDDMAKIVANGMAAMASVAGEVNGVRKDVVLVREPPSLTRLERSPNAHSLMDFRRLEA
jgi:hypothetical protein